MLIIDVDNLPLVDCNGPEGRFIAHTFIDSTRPTPRGESLKERVTSAGDIEAAKARLRFKLGALATGDSRWARIRSQVHLVNATRACPECGQMVSDADWLYPHADSNSYGIEQPSGMPVRAEPFHHGCATEALKRHEAALQRR